jgi:hypothetical protein
MEVVAEVCASMTGEIVGLSWFQLEPDDLKGQPLVEHMFTQQQICYKMDEKYV